MPTRKQLQTIFSSRHLLLTSSGACICSVHTLQFLSVTVNFLLYCCWGPAVSVSLTAGLFFSILKCKVLIRIELKFGVSVFQSRCTLEISGNVFVTTVLFANIDI